MRLPALLLALPLTAATLAAQGYPESVQRALDGCRDQPRGDDRHRACEIRTVPLPRGTRAVDIDGRTNGGVRVTAWDRDTTVVYALVGAYAPDADDAQALARDVRIAADAGRIRSTGAAPREGRRVHYVSYHVFAPRGTDVTARTHNGGIAIEGMTGRVDVAAQNGGLTIRNTGGNVRGRTTNGGISVSLTGTRLDGRGVDLETTNGSITLTLPEPFDAELEASTVNGSVDVDYPITMQGRIGRNIRATLGRGGAPVWLRTTNGGVRIRRT